MDANKRREELKDKTCNIKGNGQMEMGFTENLFPKK